MVFECTISVTLPASPRPLTSSPAVLRGQSGPTLNLATQHSVTAAYPLMRPTQHTAHLRSPVCDTPADSHASNSIYSTASIKLGPWLYAIASLSCCDSSPAVAACDARTPRPRASSTQLMTGVLRSVRERVTGPGAGSRCRAHSTWNVTVQQIICTVCWGRQVLRLWDLEGQPRVCCY